MATYLQAERPLTITTSLGKDDLLPVGFSGYEAISQLFKFQLDALAENKTFIPFDKLLGQKVTLNLVLPNGNRRYFNGICKGVSEGERDEFFTVYRLEIVPYFWLLTRRAQSRIFQQLSVPDILKKVLEGLEVSYELQGTFHPRDYCVQYRETDFNFVSRLMEEEGIYYFFKHAADGHKLILANTPQSNPDMPEASQLIFEWVLGGKRDEERIFSWEKSQELRSGKYTLWDHCFELPHKHLEAEKPILDSVQVGKVTHKLKVGGNEKLELYDYPGAYAQRFDGVDSGGGDRAGDIQKLFEDNKRTVGIRMQQEELPGIVIKGTSNCRHLVSGYRFNLERHFNADGQYLATAVEHYAKLSGDYRSGMGEFEYHNSFTCIPYALPYRPTMVTPKPFVQGTQTAVVVGPAGEEIFTDKYGRVKVQFHWDRDGEYNEKSSCWVRVGTPLAGRQWGAIHIPRIGQEVVVAFQEGDPDQPLVVGSVYNADMMPPYKLPEHKTKTGYKSYSSLSGGGFNEIRFEDKKGQEQVFIHGEKDLDVRIKNDRREWIGRDRHLIVKRDNYRQVERDEHVTIKRDQIEKMERDHHLTIEGKEAIKVTGSHSFAVTGDVIEEFQANHSEQVGFDYYLRGANVVIEGMTGLTVKVGDSFVTLKSSGVQIVGSQVLINSGGSALSGSPGSLVPPQPPGETLIADNADPGSKAPTYKNQIANRPPLQQTAVDAPSHDPKSEENKKKKSWIEIELVDEDNKPVPGERYQITLPDGATIASGTLNEKGFARVDGIDPGTCKVTFPDLDKDAWKPK
jgi:type VI secretion system secreted protein VgrG